MDGKEVTLTKQDIIILAETVEEAFERMKEIIKTIAEQLKPVLEAAEDLFQKALENEEEQEETMSYADSKRKDFFKSILLVCKKIKKRYEPP